MVCAHFLCSCVKGFMCQIGLQRYAHLTIRYVSRYRGHDTIRIAIHHKLFALLGTQILNKENTIKTMQNLLSNEIRNL